MRILHLAYEDPHQPGSGGGSVRTREVNRRLAASHDVTCVVAAYPGAVERVEDGVQWVPIGPHRAGLLPRLAWFGLLPAAIRRHRSDLVVEDFGAPFSTGLSPLYTKRPVVAVVQWLFARQMRDKYHLPFDLVERFGVRAYDDFIPVSEWLGRDLLLRRPDAIVEAIPNGLPAEAFPALVADPEHLVFLGRLDIHHKGLDLLLDALAELARRTTTPLPPLLVLGDGPDRAAFEELAAERGLAGSVRLLGRVEGAEKAALLARAHAVLMPSRFETFGIVAVEAQAAGVPLIAFDTGPLREVTGGHGALLVDPFNTSAFASALLAVLGDPSLRAAAATEARAWSRQYDWDAIAAAQERHYEQALERHSARRAARSASRGRRR